MYCLEKLQRELAYFFDMDLSALPRVQDLLKQKGYTQIQKGDEIITLEPSAQAESTLESTTQISQEIKDIIDSSPAKGRDMQIIGEANFTPQVVEYAHKNNKKVAIDKLSQAEAERLGFKHPQDVRVTIDYQAINHTLNRHGAESALVKNSGQKAVDYTDIAEYRNIVKGADEKLFSKDDLGQEVILSFKQVNGYAVVVESIRKKGNELAFKSMYFENGSYKNSNAYKNAVDSQKANPSPAPYGYEPHADANTPPLKTDTAIIPQQKPYTDEKKTLQGFEQAIAGKDTHTKIQIAKEHLEYLHTPLKEQKDQLKELIKTKNFDDDEIAEALQRIETTAKPYAKKRGNIFVPFVDKPGTGWLISDKLTPLEQAKTLIAYELERENKRFFTQVSKLGAKLRFLDRFKGVLQEKSAQEWHFKEFDETLDFIAKELKKHDKQDKDAKSYEMTYTQARDLFYKASPTQIQTELFEKVLPIAQKLGVNIRSAVRFRYERASSDFTKDIAGMYRTNPNAATLKKGISQEIKHKVLLHELIHSVTSRAIYAYDRGQLDLLTTPQQNAIKNIKEIYAELFSKRDELGLKRWQGGEHTGDYGLKNEHEMLAELANPRFVEKLKNIGLFEKLVDNIIKLIASAKEIFGLKKTNAYERLKGELESIITNYKDDFSTQWEAQKFRDRAMGSEKVDSSEPKTKHEQREQTKAILSPLINKPITNQNDGRVAQISRKNIAKMISDKAVAKSVANGFEPAEHFKAVQEVDKLYQKARLKETHKDSKSTNPNVLIHRYNADLDNANALITLKESLSGDNQGSKIYTLELEALELKPSAPEPQGSEIVSRNTGYAEPVTPTETLGEIVAQDSSKLLESTMKKFNYDGRKAKDLLEWHKDSHPLTKDENGVPKVFYHGTGQKEFDPFQNKYVNFEVFKTTLSNQDDDFLKGHYFSSNIKIAKTYNNNIYKVFLNVKNPLVIDFKGHTFNDYIDEAINNIPKSVQENIRDFYDSIIFKNIIDDNTQNGKKHPVADTIMVLDSNQIKHIENRGVESESGRKYFNDSSPNIFHSNPHLGAGLLGGSVAGVEQDENGQWRFSPEKFALGLLGSTAGSKAVAKGLEWRARKVAKSYPNIAKDNPQLMREIAKRDLHTYATASTHNALSRFLHNNKLFDINPQLFAGEKALANEAYAPHKARLENAKELEAKGAKEIEIWEQTGWYKDKDQRWKFEISQRGGELLTKDEFGRPYKRAFLSKILQDDELFNAYPKLENILVIEDKKLGRGVNASYDPKLKDIYIKNLQAKEAKISLYHELQHAIQDIEGFAYGFKDYVTSDENFHKYAIQHGEVEARNVESRMNLPTKKDVQILKRAAKNTDKNIEDLKTSDYEEWYKNERINTEQSKKKDFLAKAQAAQEVINQGKYTDHPHETMDTPLENTIAEATMHGEALSKKLGDKAGDTLKSTQKVQGESKEMQQQLQSTIQTHLENLPPNPTPQPINEAKIKALIKRFDNIENLQEHLNTRADTKARQEIFSLLDDTLQTPQVHYKKDGKDKYLKRYKSERKEPYFYLLVTKDENKTFITHFKTRDSKYLSKEITKAQEIIQGADIIEALSQRTGDI
ncbi:hypothetical protein NYG90_10465 [Helicobacter sp. XJK30-2]|uniref:Uncharacterized protein n=1 Tax=Helicobacter zhangjianzhongii TaxID=2974574 RepID=A0ACC6FWF1_9HELI|nr:LPD23 domain-containing protein [Helicobacter sp. XJK30-2]MDL0083077.1 hypothetical protein [Helicobacter sp. XJK30-2]